MTSPPPRDDSMPFSRIVRWMVLGGVVLLAVALYFRFGLHLPPMH